MKRLTTIILTLILFASFSLLSAENKNVRYIKGYINNIDGNIITLTNNLAFRANEHVTSISMTPAVFVLDENRPEGFVYIKNRKIDVTLMKKSGSKFMVPASNQDLEVFTVGKLFTLKAISKNATSVELENGDKWFLTDKDESKMIKDWKEGDKVIIYKPQHSNSERIINTRTTDHTKISKTLHVTETQ